MEAFKGTTRITEEELKKIQESGNNVLQSSGSGEGIVSEELTSSNLDKIQGEQMQTKQPEETQVEKIASQAAPSESPLAVIMAAVLNPSGTNLAGLATMFENYVENMPGLPEHVREAGRGFIASLKQWAFEQEAGKQNG